MTGRSWSAEVVHFPSASIQQDSGFPIWGHLSSPKGEGPFPALILMHGCGGIMGKHMNWASYLNDLGYVTLVIDSFRPRSILRVCDTPRDSAGPEARSLDAHGALSFLQQLPFVDADRVGLIGWSHGGIAALGAVAKSGITSRLPNLFKAVIAFYPYCILGRTYENPVLILVGEKDDWASPSVCQTLAGKNENADFLKLIIYPDAWHAFDEPELAKGFKVPGADGRLHVLQFNKNAFEDSKKRIKAFLEQNLPQD